MDITNETNKDVQKDVLLELQKYQRDSPNPTEDEKMILKTTFKSILSLIAVAAIADILTYEFKKLLKWLQKINPLFLSRKVTDRVQMYPRTEYSLTGDFSFYMT